MNRVEYNFSELNETQLLRLAEKQDEAFSELYNRYYSQIVRFAKSKLNDIDTVEDMVQDIFISLYRKRTILSSIIALKPYLFKAIQFKIMNEFRARIVRNKYCKNDFFISYSKNDFSDIETKELADKIDYTFEKLPAKCRQVFILSRKNGCTQKDISSTLNISLSTVEKHIGKALRIFKQELCEYKLAFEEDKISEKIQF